MALPNQSFPTPVTGLVNTGKPEAPSAPYKCKCPNCGNDIDLTLAKGAPAMPKMGGSMDDDASGAGSDMISDAAEGAGSRRY